MIEFYWETVEEAVLTEQTVPPLIQRSCKSDRQLVVNDIRNHHLDIEKMGFLTLAGNSAESVRLSGSKVEAKPRGERRWENAIVSSRVD